MSALWGGPGNGAVRPLFARCYECAWKGEEHHETDSEAVVLAVADAHEHNVAAHPEPAMIPDGALF